MKKKFKLTTLISNLLTLAAILFLAWVFFSWVEVITHNGPHTTGYIYNSMNIFKIISGGM